MLYDESIGDLIKQRDSLFKEIVEKERRIKAIDKEVVSAYVKNCNQDLLKIDQGRLSVKIRVYKVDEDDKLEAIRKPEDYRATVRQTVRQDSQKEKEAL